MSNTDLKICPFCGVKGEKQNNVVWIFHHRKGCFLYVYMRIQDFQFDAWNMRAGSMDWKITVNPYLPKDTMLCKSKHSMVIIKNIGNKGDSDDQG